MTPRTLTEQDYTDAAAALGLTPAHIKAVAEVESRGNGFHDDGRPVILYERHVFSRLTGGKFDSTYPKLSSKTPGGYRVGTAEWERLNAAAVLDPDAAHKSASWGKFQILGLNHAACGFPDVKTFVLAHYESERSHLDAFCAFLRSQKLVKHLIHREWAEFARRYNGKGYKRNNYDVRLATAFAKHSRASAAAA